MRHLTGLLTLTLFLVGLARPVLAQDYLLRWTFNGDDEVDMSATTGFGPVVPTPAVASWDYNSFVPTAFGSWVPAFDSYNPGDYFEFTFTISAPVSYTVTSISLRAGASGAGATNFEVRSSADNYSMVLGTAATNQPGTETFGSLNVGGSAGMPFTFRIIGLGGGPDQFNGFYVDDVTVIGFAGGSAIPEPSSMAALMGLGAMGWSLLRRRPARSA